MSYSTTKKLRIAYVVHSLNLGGTEQLVVKMSRAYLKEFEIFVVCLDEPGLWAEGMRADGIAVYCLWRQPGFDISVAMKLAKFCGKKQIDIIHAHQCTPWQYAVLSRMFYTRPRLLLEEHGRHYPEKKNTKRAIFNKLFAQPLTHTIAAVSEDVKKRLIIYEGLNGRKIEVVYNGTSPEKTLVHEERKKLREDFGFSQEDFVIGSVGRFDPIKNLPLLLQGVAEVRKKYPSLKVLLVGDGPIFSKMQELIRTLGVRDHVVTPGYRADAALLAQCMDLFALLSFSEGTSMALLEAMAAGVPTLVTDVGGNPEIVRNGETGWVVASDDQAATIRAIAEAMESPEKRRQYGKAGQNRFKEHFTFDIMINNYRKIYHELRDG